MRSIPNQIIKADRLCSPSSNQHGKVRTTPWVSIDAEFSSCSSKAASLAARLVTPNDPSRSRRDAYEEDDDEAIFAELEEEIENDSSSAVREHGLQVLKEE